MNDGLDVFRSMLSGASNRRENLRPNADSANTPSQGMGGGGGGQNAPPFGGGGGGGMDPWQQSVETRLGSLDGRLGKIDDRLGKIEQTMATLTERVTHLPTKGWGVTALLLLLAAITGLLTFQDNLKKFASGSNASEPPRIEVVADNNQAAS